MSALLKLCALSAFFCAFSILSVPPCYGAQDDKWTYRGWAWSSKGFETRISNGSALLYVVVVAL